MAKRERFDTLCIITNNAALLWKNARGIAPDDVADKMDIAMLDWQSSLTQTLRIWIEKGLSMSNGELILARANLGAVVESWLKFFYCVFYDQYSVNPKTDRSGRSIEPENLKFEDLKNFSTGKLWNSAASPEYLWVDSVQHKRNAIHSFKFKDIGTPQEFLDDIDKLYDFVDNVYSHFPPLEDYIAIYPSDYQNPYFY